MKKVIKIVLFIGILDHVHKFHHVAVRIYIEFEAFVANYPVAVVVIVFDAFGCGAAALRVLVGIQDKPSHCGSYID